MKIGVVAPACRIEPATAEKLRALAANLYPDKTPEILVHPQCHLAWGHFAGEDAARAAAFLDFANDGAIDAIWFARGGYGSGRIAPAVLAKLGPAARRKIYLGYSDMGFLFAGLYRAGIGRAVHGPMVNDLNRENGTEAVTRSLRFLVEGARDGFETTVAPGTRTAAFNITILSHLIGTPLEPDLAGHVLLLEEVSEPLYRMDRALSQITANADIRKVAGLKLGRVNAITPNDPDFGQGEEEIMRHWCRVSGIPYLGRADIGHDAANKIVPFGALTDEGWSG